MIETVLPVTPFFDIGGGLTLASDRPALVNLAKGATRILEIGINAGGTAKLLLSNIPSIVSYVGIDVPSDFITVLALQQREVPKIAGHRVADDPRVKIILKSTKEVVPTEIGECDFVFIDGDHSADGVERDTTLARACVKRGVIVWHDYRVGEAHTEINTVLDRWVDSGAPILHVKGTWLAFERVG